LDDVLSGLDSTTEEQIMTNVFGAEGIFRKKGTTVIMATNNGKVANVFSSPVLY
jgi:ATP-binding cassette, subfamily C (CFTR/MRP), member 1